MKEDDKDKGNYSTPCPLGNMGKGELATVYHRNLTYRSALNAFNRELRTNTDLWNKLIESHWNPNSRTFTVLQRELVFKYLGNPYEYS